MPDQYHQPQRLDESFSIEGRFLIIGQHDKSYGNFSWNHSANNDTLALNTPLGNTIALISVESGVASLKTKDAVYTGNNLDQLLESKLGFTLPLDYMHYWVQGIALPQYAIESSLVSGFTQLNWNVEYLKWQDINHPHIVKIYNSEMQIKLVITSW